MRKRNDNGKGRPQISQMRRNGNKGCPQISQISQMRRNGNKGHPQITQITQIKKSIHL